MTDAPAATQDLAPETSAATAQSAARSFWQPPKWYSSLFSRMEHFLAAHGVIVGCLVFVAAFGVFVSNHGFAKVSDAKPIFDLSWWMAYGNPPTLNGHPNYLGAHDRWGYWAVRTADGRIASVYPVATALLGVPYYWLLRMAGVAGSTATAPGQAKILTALLMAFACWALWLAVWRLQEKVTALVVALLFSAASPVYPNLAQALWIQTGAVFSQAASMALMVPWLVARREQRRAPLAVNLLLAAGLFAGWACMCRPTFGAWTAIALALVLVADFRQSWRFVVGVLLALGAGLWLNHAATGHLTGFYVGKATQEAGFDFRPQWVLWATLGLLFSASRGLFVFCPWSVLCFAGLLLMPRAARRRDYWLLAHGAFFVTTFGALACFKLWWGGWSMGPRLQCDLMLSGLVLAAPLIGALLRRPTGLVVLLLLFLPAAFIQHKAARMLHHYWEERVRHDMLSKLWSWQDGAWLWYASDGRIERRIRNEKREPRTSTLLLNPKQADAEKFLESGIWFDEKRNGFVMTSRHANVIFHAEGQMDSELLLGIELTDATLPGYVCNIDVSFNDQPIGTMRHITGAGATTYAFRLPREKMGRIPYDRITLHDHCPVENGLGDQYMRINALVVIPASAPAARKLEPYLK